MTTSPACVHNYLGLNVLQRIGQHLQDDLLLLLLEDLSV